MSRNVHSAIGDMALTVVAVGIVGLTYLSVSGLTPRNSSTLATKETAVLGVSTKMQQVSYFPADTSKLAFVQNFTLSGSTDLSGDATATIQLTPLESSTYSLPIASVKNDSIEFKKLTVVPTYSLPGSYTSISLVYDGKETEIVNNIGTVSPVEIVLSPSSISDISLVVRPTTKLATPVTITLDFTEAR